MKPLRSDATPIFRAATIAGLFLLLPQNGAFAVTQLHYDFSNGSGTTVTDLSGQGNHGTVDNLADTTAGAGVYGASNGWVTGGGVSFGVNDGSQVTSPLALNSLSSNFTLEFQASYDGTGVSWFAPAISSTTNTAFADWTFLGVSIDKKSVEYRAPAPLADNAAASGGLDGQPWAKSASLDATNHHIAVTYSAGSDTLETFVDGVSQGTVSTSFTLDPSNNASDGNVLRIGGSGAGVFQQWAGNISGTAVSTSVLSPGTFAIPNGSQGSTQLLYDYSNNGGTEVTDLSGNSNHGELVAFQDTTAGAGVFDSSEGWVAGGGISFQDDFTVAHVETPFELNDLTGDFTIEVTANYAGPTGASALIGSSHHPFDIFETAFIGQGVDGAGKNNITFLAPDTGDIELIAESAFPWDNLTTPPNVEEMHHVAMVFDKTSGLAEIFVDGLSIGTVDRSVSDMASANSDFIFGRTGWAAGERWDGVLYGAAISDEKLASANFVLEQFLGTPGDFDNDGDVDGADFLIWQRDPAGKSLTDWQNNYGAGTTTAAASAVPEPSSLALMLLVSTTLCGIRNRRY